MAVIKQKPASKTRTSVREALGGRTHQLSGEHSASRIASSYAYTRRAQTHTLSRGRGFGARADGLESQDSARGPHVAHVGLSKS